MNIPPQLGFAMGCLVGALMMGAVFFNSHHMDVDRHAETLIEECEQQLLRSEMCVIIAVPESELIEETIEQEKEVEAKNRPSTS